jgi:hypothetical protein
MAAAASLGRSFRAPGSPKLDFGLLSSSFDDKHGFVVDQGLITFLPETFILLYRVIQ